MNQISDKELINIGYNTKGISNYRFKGYCQKCHTHYEYSSVKKFVALRKNLEYDKWMLCQSCFHHSRTGENIEWIEKNRLAQLIAQNKPSQKQKNAIGVSKAWTPERKKIASENLKYRWINDEAFKNKALYNLQCDRKRAFINGIATGGLRGIYNQIFYDSALELSFILWCEYQKIDIIRYNKEPIVYTDENDISRKYFPDFIINETTIIEIKGKGLWYRRNFERNTLKMIAAEKQLGTKYCIYYDWDEQTKLFYKKARKTHHENKKKNTNTL